MSHDDLDDELDRRLTAAGESWRAEHQPTPVGLPGGRRRPAWVVPLAAAASVALLAGGAAVAVDVLGGHRDGSAPPAGTTQERWDPDLPPGLVPADVPGAVPPVNQPVRFPEAEAAGGYTPALSQADGVRGCSAKDVEVETAGAMRMTMRAAADDVRCSISYLPFLQYEKDGRPVEVPTSTTDPGPGNWPASVLVTPDQPAVLDISWSGWCASAEPLFDTIQLIFDDNSDLKIPAPRVDPCPARDFADDDMHYVGWVPQGFTFDPIAAMPVKARLVDTVKGPGGLPTWVVELTAKGRDVDLDTCPSWEVRQGEEQSASWRLNCAAVPDKRADGTPYLPAGKPVRFAVWVSYGGTDAVLTWRLTTVDGPVTVRLTQGPEAPTGEPRRVVERDANLHLWLSNQSFDDPEVGLTVEIDGKEMLDEQLAVEGQHNFVDFHFAVPAGEHRVVVTSDTGARVERTVRVPERGDRWAAALFLTGEKDGAPDSIDWMFQDHPIAWA
jgi:hypothetical protein